MPEESLSISVIVACPSARSDPAATVEALLAQDYEGDWEVLLVHGPRVEVPPARSRLRTIASPSPSIPKARSVGFQGAAGDLISVIACYCVPDRDWLRRSASHLEDDPSLLAVGGPVRAAGERSLSDLAGFVCEYGRIQSGSETHDMPLPGLNVTYRRAVLEAVEPGVLASRFWEECLHPGIHAERAGVIADLTVDLERRFPVRWYARQRFLYSRHYGAQRYRWGPRGGWSYRLLLPFLLPVLLVRLIRASGRGAALVFGMLPWLVVYTFIWVAGEMVGAWLGAGDSLEWVD